LQSLYREFDNLPQIVKNHVLVLKNDVGPTSTFWCSFLEMMETLLAFTRSLRLGNWHLHLAASKQMLPWFFAYDRPNYSRFMSLYLSDMAKLEETHPAVYQEFM